ncbi:lasso peptide isopeptide bond-forming cyclase [Streptomyces sp. B1866]|uniref:lasso peptide isopeptide bond-forming cyclase n=1 Tax=Streptomyces sp. B1866 TaxID=3075431 RepID=UPI00288E3AAA|nr:lasso peptide isopeptide bond-forming cyclase [Streptomyces sp. B1866]MDT3400052.1 lasso peptide isopeptide bond-forming cyclase [Streptomyces sp. B1866]
MDSPLSVAVAPAWLLVLPDTDAAAAVAAKARPHAAETCPHASGRPWLMGRWQPGELTVGQSGGVRVAVLGEHAVTAAEASRAAAAVAGPAGLDRFARAWHGSYHLLASLHGQVRAQGTVTGVRGLFHGRAGRVRLAADRADVLADLTGAPLDEGRLAVQLLSLGVLHPLSGRPVWRGVESLPGHDYLVLDRDGTRVRRARWWRLPRRDVPLAEGAPALREALRQAVGVRVRGRDLVTADLGGLDSTAVVCTAVRAGAKVAAYTAATHDPRGDDVHWARRTVQDLAAAEGAGTVEHHVVPAEQCPLTFDGVDALTDVLDGPSLFAVDHNRRMGLLRLAADRGSALHLSGFGGDELLAGASARVHDLLPRRPRAAVRHTRGYLAKYGWSRREAVRQLLDRRPYGTWLEQVADDLTSPLAPLDAPQFQWCAPPRMPPWATPDAVDAVRALVRAEAAEARPLGPGHGEHRELATMEAVARFARHLNQMTRPLGLAFASPFYDDRVVEAGLAVRTEERVTPWRYKPLIVEAMRGVVPDASRTRATKANATLEEEAGLRRHRDALLALCEDSRLARLGLVDADVWRAWCSGPVSAELENVLLHPTVGCEAWLRARESPARRARG